jgi:uncharacterized membrane protein YgcG
MMRWKTKWLVTTLTTISLVATATVQNTNQDNTQLLHPTSEYVTAYGLSETPLVDFEESNSIKGHVRIVEFNDDKNVFGEDYVEEINEIDNSVHKEENNNDNGDDGEDGENESSGDEDGSGESGDGGSGGSGDGDSEGSGDDIDNGGSGMPPELQTSDVMTNFGLVRGYKWQESANIWSYMDIPYGRFNLFEVGVEKIS